MSTSPISTLGQAIGQGGSGGDVQSQSQAPTPTQASPVQVGITQAAPAPSQPTPPAPVQQTSRLGAIVSAVANAQPLAAPVPTQPIAAPTQAAPAQPAQPTWKKVAGGIASTLSTALAGIPDKGRPSFAGGLGEGARSEQANIANQQAIRFKSFEDQVRLAQLHAQDQKLALDTQAQQDAHVKADLDNRALANSLGIVYDTLSSHGPTVMDHLTAQTAATGAASVPPGTHLSGDGETINIPQNTQATRDGQKQMYQTLGPALGLPPLPPGAQFVPPVNMNMLTNKLHGFDLAGKPVQHQDLPSAISAAQLQRDTLAKNSGTPQQLQALDNMLGIYKANLDALDTHEAGVKQQNEQATINAQNSPESIAGAAKKKAAEEAAALPFKQAQARFEQALKDGDPNSAGQLLANGDIAPSQIISSRNPSFAQKAFAAAKNADPNYNPQRAESEYKVASSPTNLTFFGSAKSLTDPGGTLDQLQTAYSKLPNGQIPKFNKAADWVAAAAGKGSTAGFAQTAIGVADDYAKVMGGGQGSDTAREEVLKSFSMAHSPQAMEAAIDAARGAVGSQMSSRIGSNKAMSRMYGDNLPQPTQYATAPGKPRMMSRDGGKTWVPALAQ